MKTTKLSIILFVAGLLAAMALGLGVRRAVYTAQVKELGSAPPFTLESALHFRRIQQLMDEGGWPEVDRAVQYPEGVRVSQTYTISDEYVFARALQVWPGEGDRVERLRWLSAAWFSLGIAGLGLWVYWKGRSAVAGVMAALCYAVMIASVIRSTGQELSRENFALPLLLWHLALQARAHTAGRRATFVAWAVASALLLALALCSWDMIQFYVLVWAVAGLVKLLREPAVIPSRQVIADGLMLAALVTVGVLNPYHRAHGFLFSPLLWLAYGVVAAQAISREAIWTRLSGAGRRLAPRLPCTVGPIASRRWVIAGTVVLVLGAGLLLAPTQASAYGHFSELVWAKIRFLNVKPSDPSLLTFSQRIMWVPALHSTTWPLAFLHFPYILWLTLLISGVKVLNKSKGISSDDSWICLFLFHGVSLIAFVLFVRFHVFLAVTSAALAGHGVAWALRRQGLARLVALAVLVAVVGEARHTLVNPRQWARTMPYYGELKELNGWLRARIPGEPVLANFGVSGSILTYGGCPVVLHPKFEDPLIRHRVKRYAELLFREDEGALLRWMDELGVRYLVYSMGKFYPEQVEYQMRYFVDAVDPSPAAPARFFERRPEGLSHFRLVWENRKYRVFRRLAEDDDAVAGEKSRAAQHALERGELDEAERLALQALEFNAGEARAVEVLRLSGVLRQSGFRGTRGEP